MYLIIDALHAFLRNYVVNPSISTTGIQIGGVIGFLNSLKNIVFDLSPNKVFIIWESGGSQKRRHIYPDYKSNRRPVRLNRL